MLYVLLSLFLVLFQQGNGVEIEDCKQAIALQQQKIDAASPNEKAAYFKELALLYLQDQDQEKAFKTFMEGLDLMARPEGDIREKCSIDDAQYKQILAIYLNSSSESPEENARNLIRIVSPIFLADPDQYVWNYFLAIAYANLGKYPEFFKHFYSAYSSNPNHYLAYKTKAILSIKLLERTREEAVRVIQRQKIINYLTLALASEAKDTSIYRLMIGFSPLDKKKDQVKLSLNKIINNNIIIPRNELMFYVVEAADIKDPELAQRFINRAKEWYPESRIVLFAQKYLNRQLQN